MDFHRTCRRAAAFVLTLALTIAMALPGGAVYAAMPIRTANAQESIYLFNAVTGEVLLDQNADQQRCVASLTKMMTALLLMESGKDLNETITVPDSLTPEFANIRSQNGTRIVLTAGEQIRRMDLLYALLVCSANDAASVIAWDVAGSIPAFVQQMNARAAALGCTSTQFSCPHGLYDDAMCPMRRIWQKSHWPAPNTKFTGRSPIPCSTRSRPLISMRPAPSTPPTR